MQKYVLITHDKQKFILSEKEKDAVFNAILSDKKFAIVQGSMLPMHITPLVITFERWFTQENERLKMTDRRLCNQCMSIMNVFDKCKCWEGQGIGKKQDGFVAPELPAAIKQRLHDGIKEFPQLSAEEKQEIQGQEAAQLEAPKYTPDGGYIDQESGETHYS